MKTIRSYAFLLIASLALAGVARAEEKCADKGKCEQKCEQKCDKACTEKCEGKADKAACECPKDKDGKVCGTDKPCCCKDKK